MKIKSLTPWLICLVPSFLALGSIGLGIAFGLPMFRLAWDNYFLFALLGVAAICPLSKIPLVLFFHKPVDTCVICQVASSREDRLVFSNQKIETMRLQLERVNRQIHTLENAE